MTKEETPILVNEARNDLYLKNNFFSIIKSKMKNEEKVILEAYSKEGDSDWYGDFNYYDNPLSHYSNSNMCAVTTYGGSSHGYGIAKIRVETTIDFIKMMGWEKDLIYRVKK